MSTAFISYSMKDNFAINVLNELKHTNLIDFTILNFDDVWSKYNDSIENRTMDLIKKCDYFICFFDKFSYYIMFELGYALGKNKNVILIGEPNDIPYALKNFKYIKRTENVSQILMELNKGLYHNEIRHNNTTYSEKYIDNILRMQKEQDFIDSISYFDFEKIIYDYLKAQNLEVEYPTRERDSGYDFMLPEIKCIIEVKKYSQSSKVSLSTIRSLLGSMVENNVNTGIIISNSEFTKSAINFVQNLDQKIILLSLQNLIDIDGNFMSIFEM